MYPATIAAFPYLVAAVSRVQPDQRAYWLDTLAELEAMRVTGQLEDPEGHVDAEMMEAYQQALVQLAPLAAQTLATQAEWEGRERNAAALLALLAFARGEQRLGYILARWWPYGVRGPEREHVPVAALEQFEAFTGQRSEPLNYDAAK